MIGKGNGKVRLSQEQIDCNRRWRHDIREHRGRRSYLTVEGMKDQAKFNLMIEGRRLSAGKTREVRMIVRCCEITDAVAMTGMDVGVRQTRRHLRDRQIMTKVGNPVKMRAPLRRRKHDDEEPAQ